METRVIPIENPKGLNLIFGQSHFVKTVEDLHETLVGAIPGIHFGLAFCEASAATLVRTSGTDPALAALAAQNVLSIGAGHTFLIFLEGAYPINVLNAIKAVPEVCHVFCATANPVQVIVGVSEQGRGVLGVIDGASPRGIESEADREARRAFLRKIGYKL